MIIERLTTPGLAIHSYLVGCPAAGEAVLIDPTRHVGGLMALAERHRLRITHSIDTHVHADFLSGGPELKAILGDALTIHSSGLGGEEWTQAFADNVLADGDSVTLVKDLKLKGSSAVIKVGTKVKNIRLVDGDHDIDCKIEGFGAMQLKSEFVRKS